MDKALREALANNMSVKVPPLAKAANVSASHLYDAIERGEVKAVRIGRSVRVPPPEARRLLGLDTGQGG